MYVVVILRVSRRKPLQLEAARGMSDWYWDTVYGIEFEYVVPE